MKTLTHKFVKNIPEHIENNVLYVSLEYSTAIHNCCCGCGNEVVTPFSPTDWKLIYDGETVSLSPSIGNWNFECKSHYYITNNEIHWAESWSDEEIKLGRLMDKKLKSKYYSEKKKTFDTNSNKLSNRSKWNIWNWFNKKRN